MAQKILNFSLFDQLLNDIVLLHHQLTYDFDRKKHSCFPMSSDSDISEFTSA